MPVQLHFEGSSLCVARATGAVLYSEVQAAIDELVADERVGGQTEILVDGRDATSAPTIAEVAAIAHRFGLVMNRGVKRVALLVENDWVLQGAQVFAGFTGVMGARTRVFRDLQSALQWLAVPPDP